MNDFDQIFYSTTTSTTKKEKFNFEKPPGWNKKPKKKYKLFEFFRIIYGALKGKEMEPSDYRSLDIWLIDLKAILACVLFAIIMFYVVTSKLFSSTEYTEGAEKNNTIMDKAIDYVIGKKKPKQKEPAVVIIKDSFVNIDDSVAYILRQSDSILNVLRHMDDSLIQKK